jgi:hypothetical protein
MKYKRISILLMIVLLFLAGLACSVTQRFITSPGITGESQDAKHDQWSDLLGPDQENADPQDAGSDTLEGESRSSDGADTNHRSGSLDKIQIDPSLDQTALGQRIKSGDMIIELIESTGGGTQGQIIEMVIINQSSEEIIFEVPPGLVFSPVGTDEQELMVLDGEVVTLEPAETIVLSPYVICIESSASTPSSGSAYEIGYLADGDLLAFAECVDQETNGDLYEDDIGLQFAVWSIANHGSMLEMPEGSEEVEGAFSELTAEWEILGLLETMTELMSGMSENWLQRCDISVGGEE